MIDIKILIIAMLSGLALYLLTMLILIRVRFQKAVNEIRDLTKEARKIVEDVYADMEQMADDSGKVMAIAELLAEFHLTEEDETLIALNQKFYELPENIWTQLPKTGEIAGSAPEPDDTETGGGGDYFND
jgi:hypothetical protein